MAALIPNRGLKFDTFHGKDQRSKRPFSRLFLHIMNGKTFEDAVINNRAWDDSCWSTKIDGDRFYHHMRNAPAGHFDSIFLYKDWDGQCVTATLYRIRNEMQRGRYYIRNRNTQLVLDVARAGTSNGTKVICFTKNNGTNQQWETNPEGVIKSTQSGKLLDWHVGSDLVIWENKGFVGQRWIYDGLYIRQHSDPTKVLECLPKQSNGGREVAVVSYSGRDTQQWEFLPK